MNRHDGIVQIDFKGKAIEIKYHYWSMAGTTYINLYDKQGKEYRFARLGRSWKAIREGNTWPLEFRKVLGAELEKLHDKLK